jgi:hypothetical protein
MVEGLWDRLAVSLGPRVDDLVVVAEVASSMGFRSALVGGAVRDLLLQRRVLDLDVVIEGDAVAVGSRLAQSHGFTLRRHEFFGTATLRMERGAVDLASTRSERYEPLGSLPKVQAAGLTKDLARRDFTINAMALFLDESQRGELVDLHGGLDDLKKGLLRTLHPDSFLEDPTRAWRAARYGSRYGFSLAEETQRSLGDALGQGAMKTVSLQRLGAEWQRCLNEADPTSVWRVLSRLDLFAGLHPELGADSTLVPRLLAVLESTQQTGLDSKGRDRALWLALSMGLSPSAREATRDFGSTVKGWAKAWETTPPRLEKIRVRCETSERLGEWGEALRNCTDSDLILLHSGGCRSREAVTWWLKTGRFQQTAVSSVTLLSQGVTGPSLGCALERARRSCWEGGSEQVQWRAAQSALELPSSQ